MTEPDPPQAHDVAQAALPADGTVARHARGSSRRLVWVGIAVAAALVLGGSAAVTAALTAPVDEVRAVNDRSPAVDPPPIASIPDPEPHSPEPAVETPSPCDDPAVVAALDEGTDAGVIAAAGGGEAFRAAIATGAAHCIDLSAADRIWVVVNKRHPLDPIDYWPIPQAQAAGVQRTSGGHMRADVAAALEDLASAAVTDGPGAIGVNSGFRSYDFQVSTYSGYVSSLGQVAADRTSARPGHSEHQTGLAVDVVACSGGCGGIEGFGRTAQADWVAANAWRFGFVVRYEDGQADVTGYDAEPWHLRYIGIDLAAVYHEGGYRSLEDFFGLEPAPDYRR
ncbi:D-alanyl-D-alanine carboxypeptidase family protein [Microbacterium invictum]|uniref:D-alanyl-D-alanine carboxypeptidase n=1 Tax=Microbacterium invictum TaxID=515415 RepID=A0AA40SQ99_9MICO|nr:M15 family metallopeptidase [Microbacterium invictum]MBB4140440.1 D-alanyl-D-alanine carboxypeptidase [Microbacterium invictum]